MINRMEQVPGGYDSTASNTTNNQYLMGDNTVPDSGLRYRHYSGHAHLEDTGPPAGHAQYSYYDTEELEKYRLERKRERNRIAATKCR